ncbi:hypothetical protein GGX14DRAFT_410405 [Mycena pura]|uniref:Uncharacterized protein n=1 Tax=Mycena pura TaxID=153505 RepID=A0AAD7E5N3_9AGAR|nr:hypothetical protein GGX14DRAFT_410405 [Mycena pura]
MLNHILKRGVAHLQAASPAYMAKLQQDAELYEAAGPDMSISPTEMLPVFITGVIVSLILASIHYTLGHVVASLAMIESPSSVAVVEQKLPAYTDDEPLIPSEADAVFDVEISVVNRKPITASVCATMRHLRSVGGFFARWRGLGVRILYGFAEALVGAFLWHTVGRLMFGPNNLFGSMVLSIATSLILVRVHMLWTHAMIAHQATTSLRRRLVPRAQCKPLLLPTLAVAAAQHATVLVPLGVAHLLGLPNMSEDAALAALRDADPAALALLALRLLAVPAAAALVAFFALLPATVARTRIEAVLLPADAQPVVPFDRAALVGSIDLAAPRASRALFVAAWRSVDRPARVRLLKLYAKMLAAQLAVALVGVQLMAAEVYLIGGERLTVLLTSARAQLELAAVEMQQKSN